MLMEDDIEISGLADGRFDVIRLEGEGARDKDRLRGLEYERERERARFWFKLKDRALGAPGGLEMSDVDDPSEVLERP
jgi:hypothetical protein